MTSHVLLWRRGELFECSNGLDTPPIDNSDTCHPERNAMRSGATNGMESRDLLATGSCHDQGDPSALSRAKLVALKYYTARDAGRDDKARCR